MEELLDLLNTNPAQAISKMTETTLLKSRIIELRAEFEEIYRKNRKTQVGYIQKDKLVGKGERARLVQGVRVPIPFQNKIVRTATAFEVGEPPTLIPQLFNSKERENNLTKEIQRLWKVNRLNHIIQKAVELKKSELQCAVLYYIEDIEPENLFNRIIGLNKRKEIKTKLLQNKDGVMTPVFDGFGDMKAFVWEFVTRVNDKDVKNAWVYTDKLVYKLSNKTGVFKIDTKDPHGFGKIPVVYFHQPYPEWHISEKMIDRIEVAMSKLAASNDYSGHPILKLYGEVMGAPDKDEDGKALRFNVHEDPETRKVSHGDAKFLTHDNAPESVKLELERLEKYIYSLTSTPDLSLENLKGIGDISGKAIRLMFMDAIIKSKMNEGENRTSIERMVNVFISGVVNTTATSLKSEASNTFFDIKFNSILPSEINEDIQTYVQAVNGKIMSKRQAIKEVGMAEDIDNEMEQIKKEYTEEAAVERTNSARRIMNFDTPPIEN